jgi:hypothetical protein
MDDLPEEKVSNAFKRSESVTDSTLRIADHAVMRFQKDVARLTVWRKSSPVISTLIHISANRESILFPIRSPRVSSRAAFCTSERLPFAAGKAEKWVVIMVD